MSPSECARRAWATRNRRHRFSSPSPPSQPRPASASFPACTIASKGCVRSLLLVRRAHQPLNALRSVAADTASRTTVAYTRILFTSGEIPPSLSCPMAADLDSMLEKADAAIVIGDPALFALEERSNRFERTGEELVYHDLAHEWRFPDRPPFVSAIWGTSYSGPLDECIGKRPDPIRIHGQQNIEPLAAEWSRKLPISESTIRAYLTTNIHYILDEECIEGMKGFFRMAAEANVLPNYTPKI